MVEEHSAGITPDDIVPSEEWELVEEFYGTLELNRKFVDCLDDDNPWYSKESPYGEPIIHPAVLLIKTMDIMMNKWAITPGPSTSSLHAKQESELHYPAKIGMKVRIEVRVPDKYIKRGKTFIVFEARCSDESERPFLVTRLIKMIGGM